MARTTLDIDEALLDRARSVADGDTKTAVVHEALREFIRVKGIERLRARIGRGHGMTLEEFLAWRRNPRRRDLHERLRDEPSG